MLTLIESLRAKNEAMAKLRARLEKAWDHRERRVVVWRPDSRTLTVHHNGKYWFASLAPNKDDLTPRFWNPFGEYRAAGNFQIAVELNVPTASNSGRVSGFFATDAETGSAYLMHDGGVGGGRKGVGRTAFLAWSDSRLVPVVDQQGDIRLGIVVAPVDAESTSSDIARFVQKTIDFKEAVVNGETETEQARAAQQRYGEYFDEYAGKKRRRRIKEIEYISRHGDIVRALRDWRAIKLRDGERVFKDSYVDLGVRAGGELREIYEVKTSCERQSLYSAIGQIVVHDNSLDGHCGRFLVLPNDDIIPEDVESALLRARISLIRFVLHDDGIQLLEHHESWRRADQI